MTTRRPRFYEPESPARYITTPGELWRQGIKNTNELSILNITNVFGDPLDIRQTEQLGLLLKILTKIGAAYELNFGFGKICVALNVRDGFPCNAAVKRVPPKATAEQETKIRLEVIESCFEGNRQSIRGGSILVNFTVDREEAEAIRKNPLGGKEDTALHLVIAPSFTREARERIRCKGNEFCRMFTYPNIEHVGIGSIIERQVLTHVGGGAYVIQIEKTEVPMFPPDILSTAENLLRLQGEAMRYTPENRYNLVLAWAIATSTPGACVSVVSNQALIANGVGLEHESATASAIQQFQTTPKRGYSRVAFSTAIARTTLSIKHLVHLQVQLICLPEEGLKYQDLLEPTRGDVTFLYLN